MTTSGASDEPSADGRHGGSPTQAGVPQFAVDETVQMRKSHPCGVDTWTVTRVGGDVGLRCSGCGRRIFLSRRELARRLRPSHTRKSEPGPIE